MLNTTDQTEWRPLFHKAGPQNPLCSPFKWEIQKRAFHLMEKVK